MRKCLPKFLLSAKNIVLLVLFLVLILPVGCRKDKEPLNIPTSKPASAYESAFIRSYFDLTCKIVKNTSGFFPPQASRAYGYISLALYESTVPGIDETASLTGQLSDLKSATFPKPDKDSEYNWAISANAATAEMIRKMFEIKISAEHLTAIDEQEKKNKMSLSSGISGDVVLRSEAFGKSVTAALYEFSKSDGGHQSFLNPFQLPYILPLGDDQWVPTGAAQSPVAPKWGTNRAFLFSNVSQTEPPAPYNFSTDPKSPIYEDAIKVYNQVKSNTPEQVLITKYWADDPFSTCTPTGHTINILTQLLEENKSSLAKAALAYAQMGVAEHDAFIACWKCKYKTNRLRPVTYIKKYIDPSFNTVIGTPPFPAYDSGHSAEIGAGSVIFTHLFTNGDGKYTLTDRSQIQYGFSPRTWNSFNEMAQECADSRFFGGIHFLEDNTIGLTQGKKVGQNVISMIKWPKGVK
ncbi:MAG: vanadium-dependent haloperoxidase [Flavobacterium sp.]|nr:vanadium-dependent haloperoxidase [Pedobacter sp.]